MQTLFEAAGRMDGMRRLAHAWHERVMADEVVAHAFSHGFKPDHTERLAAIGRKRLAARLYIPILMATKPPSSSYTAAMASTRKWIAVPLPASTRLWMT
jgi:hypothetical protein